MLCPPLRDSDDDDGDVGVTTVAADYTGCQRQITTVEVVTCGRHGDQNETEESSVLALSEY